MGMSSYSRRENEKRRQEYQKWYASLSVEERAAEDKRRIEAEERAGLVVTLGTILMCIALAVVSSISQHC